MQNETSEQLDDQSQTAGSSNDNKGIKTVCILNQKHCLFSLQLSNSLPNHPKTSHIIINANYIYHLH